MRIPLLGGPADGTTRDLDPHAATGLPPRIINVPTPGAIHTYELQHMATEPPYHYIHRGAR